MATRYRATTSEVARHRGRWESLALSGAARVQYRVIISTGLALLLAPLVHAEPAPSVDEVIAGIARSEKLLFENDSLLLRYARTKTERLIATGPGGLLEAEWTLAYKEGKWFTERRFTHPLTTKMLMIPAEPKTQVMRERFVLDWDQTMKQASIGAVAVDLGGNFYGGLLYTRNLSLDAPKYIAKSEGIDIAAVRRGHADEADLPFLPEFLNKNKAHYRVLEAPEDVDGAPCWLVEWPGMDRFWVDPQRGFAIPRRIYSWAPGKPVRFEFHHHNYRQVKPGLWLPELQTEDDYASVFAEPGSLWGQVKARSECELQEIQFNNVPDSRFEVKLPAGTRVYDNFRRLQYTVSAEDREPFADTIEAAKGWRSWRRWARLLALLAGGSLAGGPCCLSASQPGGDRCMKGDLSSWNIMR